MPYKPQLKQSLKGFSACPLDFKHWRSVAQDPARNEEMHIHDACEIYVNVTGEGTFMVENRLYPVARGDMILTAPNEMHHGVFLGEACHEHYCIWFPAGENTAWLTRFFDRPRGAGNLLSLSAPDKERLLRLLARMECELEGSKDVRSATVSFLQLLLLIETAAPESAESVDVPYPLSAILDELRKSYREPIRMAEMAERYFISQSTLNRLFHTYLRISPYTYLEHLRLAHAKRLLAAGQDVTATALECGFSDSSHFIFLFRRRFGITPGKYRKNCAEASPGEDRLLD